jgi:hypothetical protein
LMRAVKHRSNKRVPEPRCHGQSLAYEVDHSLEN